MSDEVANGLSVEEQQTLRSIHEHMLKAAGQIGGLTSTVSNVSRDVSRLAAVVDSTRIEVVKHGQLVGTLTSNCTARGETCQGRFLKQSEELDRVVSSLDSKIGRIADTTNRIRIVGAEQEGAKKGWRQSWGVAVAVIGWGIAIFGIVAGIAWKVS